MALSTEMTPRARRMLLYCAAGFLIYLMIQFMELVQNLHLNRIDEQLKALDQQANNYEVDNSSPALSVSSGPVSLSGLIDGPRQ